MARIIPAAIVNLASVFDFAPMLAPFIFKRIKRIHYEQITRPQAIVTEEMESDLLITPLKENIMTAACSIIKLLLCLSTLKSSAMNDWSLASLYFISSEKCRNDSAKPADRE
jgi:hypothetical protein